MFNHLDMTGRQIDIGDIVLFTEPGAGRNLPSLCFGEVDGLTKASVRVFLLDKQFNRIQVEETMEDRSVAPYFTSVAGKEYYAYKGTGRFRDKAPVAVKIYKDRFYIVKKV